jgi:hypothetical protein
MSPRQLNQRLQNCRNVTDMLGLHELHRASFDDINIATCWVMLRKAHSADLTLVSRHRDQLAGLREHTLASASSLDTRAVANIVHALAALKVNGREWAPLWAQLERACIERISGMNPLELALTVSAFVRAGRLPRELFVAIAAHAAPRLASFRAFDLSLLAGCFVGAGYPFPALLDAVASEAIPRVHELNPTDVGALAATFAKADRPEPELFNALAAHALRILQNKPTDFSTAALAQTAWAFARAAHPSPELLDAIGSHAATRLGKCSAVQLSRLAWAMATAERPAPELFHALARLEPSRLDEFTSQGLANTAWAVAISGSPAPALLDAIAAQATARMREFSCKGLSMTAYAYAKAEHAAPALFDALATTARHRMNRFDAVDLSNTAWAFATAHIRNEELFRALAQAAIKQEPFFSPQGLSSTAWAFATVGIGDKELFGAIAQAAIKQAPSFSSQGLAITAWAFAMVGRLGERPELVEALCEQAAGRLSTLPPDELCMIAWACAVADRLPQHSDLFGPSFGRRCDELACTFPSSSLSQLHQWRLWYCGERGQVAGLPSASLQAQCAAGFVKAEVHSSGMQDNVGRALASVGLSADSEVVTAEGYKIDYMVRFRGATFALEVDGPTHFVKTYRGLADARGRWFPNGATILKHRQVRHFGARLVTMPFWDWRAIRQPGADLHRLQRRMATYLWLAMALEQRRGRATGPDGWKTS